MVIFRSNTSKNSITGVVHKYLEKTLIYPNNIISEFQKSEHPILHDEVKAIIVGDVIDCVCHVNQILLRTKIMPI